MNSPSQLTSVLYSQAIHNIIKAADQLALWLSSDNEQDKGYAFDRLLEAAEELRLQTERLEQGSSAPDSFFGAAIDMQVGYLLIEAQRGIESGDKTGIERALSNLQEEQKASAGELIVTQMFDEYLMHPPRESKDDASALEDFKERAEQTLDNMVSEAKQVISSAIKEFKDTFDKIYEALGKLMNVLFTGESVAAIAAGLEKVVDSLNKMTKLFKHEGSHQIIDSLKDMVHGFNLESLVAKAFAVDRTKGAIAEVQLSETVDQGALLAAGTNMAELSRQYVSHMQQIKRVLTVVGMIGGMLLLTGMASHYVEPALPVVYALVALITILIGIHFADGKMREIISGL